MLNWDKIKVAIVISKTKRIKERVIGRASNLISILFFNKNLNAKFKTTLFIIIKINKNNIVKTKYKKYIIYFPILWYNCNIIYKIMQ